jgi:hypothetical protein
MSTSSGRKGSCERCGHFLDGHARTSESKCKKCHKLFDICQVATHRGWRICFIPCNCGEKYYPDKARAAVPLASHEYQPNHPGYRALTPENEEYDTTTDQASSSTAKEGYADHARNDSTGSDPLAWSTERYQRETTGSMDELVDTMHGTHIGGSSITVWSEWAWDAGRQQWGRYRMSAGEYEYEWQAPESSSSSTSKPEESTNPDWSEWEFNEEHQRWCRGRMFQGKYEVEWDNREFPENDKVKGKDSSHKRKGRRR